MDPDHTQAKKLKSHRRCCQMDCLWSTNQLKLRCHWTQDPSTSWPSNFFQLVCLILIEDQGPTPATLRPGLETEETDTGNILASVSHLYLLMAPLSARLYGDKKNIREIMFWGRNTVLMCALHLGPLVIRNKEVSIAKIGVVEQKLPKIFL